MKSEPLGFLGDLDKSFWRSGLPVAKHHTEPHSRIRRHQIVSVAKTVGPRSRRTRGPDLGCSTTA
jgi:hypothetical protein